MTKNYLTALIFTTIFYLGSCATGFAQDREANSVIYSNENNTSSQSPLLTRQEIIDAFDAGIVAGATHMLIVWDTWDFEGSYQFVVYSFPGEDINHLIKFYDAPGYSRVSAVLAMHLDLNEQLSNKRWYPEYP